MYSGIIQRYSECTVSIEYTLIRADAVYLVDRVNKARIQRVFEKLFESLAAGLMCVLWLLFREALQKTGVNIKPIFAAIERP